MKRALEDPPKTAAASAASAIQVSFTSTPYKESENKTKNKQTDKQKAEKYHFFAVYIKLMNRQLHHPCPICVLIFSPKQWTMSKSVTLTLKSR